MNLDQSVAEHNEQIAQILSRLSAVMDRQERLDNALIDLTEVQKQLAEKQNKTDERIENLVSAIGKLLTRP